MIASAKWDMLAEWLSKGERDECREQSRRGTVFSSVVKGWNVGVAVEDEVNLGGKVEESKRTRDQRMTTKHLRDSTFKRRTPDYRIFYWGTYEQACKNGGIRADG